MSPSLGATTVSIPSFHPQGPPGGSPTLPKIHSQLPSHPWDPPPPTPHPALGMHVSLSPCLPADAAGADVQPAAVLLRAGAAAPRRGHRRLLGAARGAAAARPAPTLRAADAGAHHVGRRDRPAHPRIPLATPRAGGERGHPWRMSVGSLGCVRGHGTRMGTGDTHGDVHGERGCAQRRAQGCARGCAWETRTCMGTWDTHGDTHRDVHGDMGTCMGIGDTRGDMHGEWGLAWDTHGDVCGKPGYAQDHGDMHREQGPVWGHAWRMGTCMGTRVGMCVGNRNVHGDICGDTGTCVGTQGQGQGCAEGNRDIYGDTGTQGRACGCGCRVTGMCRGTCVG